MKFKVGDKVKVREWDDMAREFEVGKNNSIQTPVMPFVDDMKMFCGRQCSITKEYSGFYQLDCSRYYFTDDMLKMYEFTKSDLKTGMVVETRNLMRYMVCGNRIVRTDVFVTLSHFKDNLLCDFNNNYDIVKCFDVPQDPMDTIDILENPGELLWERKPEEKVISSDEAFKVLKEHYGCDVKIKGNL